MSPVTDPARPMTRQERKRATRHKVDRAAIELFRSGGYDSATIRDIAAKAGVSTGAVFASYADKAALFEGCMGRRPPDQRLQELLGCLADRRETLSAGALAEKARILLADLFGPDL